MPDTGAPWNIPYVESTDLVSDWPTDSLALANAIEAGLDAAGNAGIGSNVVSTTKDNVFSTASSGYQDVTGLAVTITPTSATSKIYVVAYVTISASQANTCQIVVDRGGSPITEGSGGTSPGAGAIRINTADDIGVVVSAFLDSPATTSAVTYQVQAQRGSGGTLYINQSGGNANIRDVSTLTAIEVAA